MGVIMNASVIVSLIDQVSGRLRNIGDMAEDVQRRVGRLQNMRITGLIAAGAGTLGFAAVSTAIAKSTDAAMEFEEVMNNVKVAAFGKDLMDKNKIEEVKRATADLTEGFEKLGIASKFNDTTVGTAALNALRGGISKDFLLGSKDKQGKFDYAGLSSIVYSAQLGDVDPSEAGDFIAKMKASYDLTAQRALASTNFFAKTSAASTVNFRDLISGMQTAAGVSGQIGMSPEDTAMLVAATGTYTKDGGAAGTFTKDFLDRLMPHTNKQKNAMKDLGWLDSSGKSIFFDEKGIIKGADFLTSTLQAASKKFKPNEFQALMSKVFLEQGKVTALALATESNVYKKIKDNVGNQLDMYQQVDVQMSGTKKKMETLQETWNVTKRLFGEPFLEPLKKAFQGLGKVLSESIVPWAKAHPEVIKTVATIALGVSAFVAISGVALTLVSTFGLLRIGLAAVGTTIKGVIFRTSLLFAPFAIIAGAAYLIYRNWDKIVPYAKAVWTGVKEAVEPVAEWFETNISPSIKEGISAVKGEFANLEKWVVENKSKIEGFFGFSRKSVKIGHDTDAMEKLEWRMPDWLKPLQEAGSKMIEIGKSIKDNWALLEPVIKGVAAAVLTYKAYIIAANFAIKAYAFTVGIITNITRIWTAAQWLLNIALTANPIGLVIAAVAGLIVGAYYLYKNWDEISKKTVELWENMGSLKYALVAIPFVGLLVSASLLYQKWDSIVLATQKMIVSMKELGLKGFLYIANLIKHNLLPMTVTLLSYFDKIAGTNYAQQLQEQMDKTISGMEKSLRGLTDQKYKIEIKEQYIEAAKTYKGKEFLHVKKDVIDGSHYSGLGYVPFDGYIAQLHKGEMVVPRIHADAIRNMRGAWGTSSVSTPVSIPTSKGSSRPSESLTIQFNGDIIVHGGDNPEEVGKQVRGELNQWAKQDLPKIIKQIEQRKQNNKATFRPGLAT